MICKKCGAEIEDGAVFCSKCGEKQEQETEYTPVQTKKAVPGALTVFIMGILSLALPVMYSIPLGGLICGIICNIKVKEYTAAGGELAGKASIGRALGIAGLIVSIVSIVLSVVAIIMAILCWSGLIAIIIGAISKMPEMAQYIR